MRRKYRKIFLSLLVLIALVGGWVYCKWTGHISHVKVRATKSGWVCSIPIELELSYPHNKPILSRKNLVVAEKYRRSFYVDGFKIVEAKMGSPRDDYYVTALKLSNGHIAYRKRVKIKGQRLQVVGIWPWRENVLVWGYYQEEPHQNNKLCSITIINRRGKILNRFPLSLKPVAVDEKNNLLICRGLHMLELPSGEEKHSVSITRVVHLVPDNNGNLYILRRLKGSKEGDKEGIYDALAEKYSSVPWKKHWSERISGTADGYPIMLKYEDKLLWYAIYDEHGGPFPENRRKWVGAPLDAETGERIETDRTCNPYRIETELDNKRYVVTKKDGDLHVRIIPLKANKQP